MECRGSLPRSTGVMLEVIRHGAGSLKTIVVTDCDGAYLESIGALMK